ncbi:MAG: transcription-repair coupling factor [Prevotellaceae bacterium]|nr:transcription-repair coupling factor [Prevotellaceae bacterium]
MNLKDFQQLYARHPQMARIDTWAASLEPNINISGLSGGAFALVLSSFFQKHRQTHVVVLNEEDEAAYVYNDVRKILGIETAFFYPGLFKKALRLARLDSSNEILRTEALNRLTNKQAPCIVFTYPEAIVQKTVSSDELQSNILKLKKGEMLDPEFFAEALTAFGFVRVDFVYEPGQFAVRGGIVDVFSYAYEYPYRFDFFGDEIDSIRVFDIESQLSKEQKEDVEIVPDLEGKQELCCESFFEFLPANTFLSFSNIRYVRDKIDQLFDSFSENADDASRPKIGLKYIDGKAFVDGIGAYRKMEWGRDCFVKSDTSVRFKTSPQPVFHKNFDLIGNDLRKWLSDGYRIYILSDSEKQTDRIAAIFEDRNEQIKFQAVKNTLHEGFIDHDLSMVCYTDHQIFDRFHKYQLRIDKAKQGKVLLTLKDINQLQIGDYVVHVDHGIGVFGGLVRMDENGRKQEVVKLKYKDNDVIFVGIHALHRIAKYKGKEGESPRISKLGSGTWERLKERTKSKVKDIARELIKLYAQRKAEKGFSFTPDSYLQHELEASFIYEDTPDQVKATADVKKDMESDMPMDRLICGDVGFGKTEVAIRAAFKAVADGKQVAVLVPTTVLALQHYNTFKGRLKNFPCTIDYLSRARTSKVTKEIISRLSDGKIDIIIGTHKLVGNAMKFKDLGLLIIDEEQKFGVSVKEKLKRLKVNVDTLTMTATPIPRTLQFSLMGARDLSIITTPPPNRYPVQTELHTFDEQLIKEAIQTEMNRNGQVFFVNNNIHNIYAMESMIRRLAPGCRVAVGHGQMSPDKLEEIILDFIDYEYDVLVATTIIESGVDIPNVNTMIINSAHHFGLSDLHQLRGRVGRSNRKAYCYLIAPDLSLLTPDARRRLQALETFSDLGSGFNIAMQDLDIRGAGNLLGAEQSGFIADLGYETYQRILNEAVQELKMEEFAELYDEEQQKELIASGDYVNDCRIESDMELMFPADYIENVSERIALYKELDGIESEEKLRSFAERLKDRFGRLPHQTGALFDVVRLRWIAIRYGVERLVLKNRTMIVFLPSNLQSFYYRSENFGKILQHATVHHNRCRFREQNGKRSIVYSSVHSIHEALAVFDGIDHQSYT